MEADLGAGPLVGELGESPEQLERRRIATVPLAGVPVPLKSLLPDVRERAMLRQELRVLVSEIGRDLRSELGDVARAVSDQAAALKTIDVPLEQVADSHERATHSFETLRGEIAELGTRIGTLEQLCGLILAELRR